MLRVLLHPLSPEVGLHGGQELLKALLHCLRLPAEVDWNAHAEAAAEHVGDQACQNTCAEMVIPLVEFTVCARRIRVRQGVAGGARADPEAVEGPHEVQVEGRVAAEEERPRAIGPQCQNPGAVGPMGAGVLQQRLAILALQPQADDAQRAAVLVQ